ncbi:hypothetical protein AAG906_004340 [Vitis piasezkii]
MGKTSPLRNPLETRGSACVEVLTTLHGNTPSPWRRVEGCVPPEGTIASARDPLTHQFYLVESPQPYRSIFVPTLGLPSQTRVKVCHDHGFDSRGYSWSRLEDRWTDAILLPIVAPIPASKDAHARMDKLEQRMRQMRISDGATSWDDFDGAPVASLSTQFRMSEIERYTGIGCPKFHLRLYNIVMRAHGLDVAQLIMLFPMSLSGATQRWFAFLDASCRRTCDDLDQEFLRQFAFNIVIDGPEESMTSFISRLREKIVQIVYRPSEKDQITCFCCTCLKETSYLIPSAPSPTYYYSSCIEADMTVLPTRYAFEPSFPEAHGGCPSVPFILWRRMTMRGRDIEIVTRSGRVVQHLPLVARLFDGATSHEEVRRENDELHIHIKTTTTPRGFRPYTPSIYYNWLFRPRVPSILMENDSTLNVCPLATAIALGYAPSDFGPSTQTVRAYDSTKREVMGTLMIEIPTSFNLLLGRPWIHRVGAIPYSLHQKVKFIHDRQVQTLEVEDFCRDFVAMSFDQHSSTVVLDMMRGMSFLLGMGLGRRQHGPMEFERVRAHLTGTPFDYPVRPYKISLADYFVRGSEVHSHMGDFGAMTDINGVDELQHQFHHLQLGDETSGAPVSVMIASSSPNRANFLSLCFLEETTDCGVVIAEMVQPELASLFDLFGESAIEIAQPDSNKDSFDHDSDLIDKRVSPATRDVETVDFGTEDQPRELKICSPLSTNERDRLIHLLRGDSKQLSVGFILVVEYPEWLANVVPVPKKDGKVRVCVDFRDLNKASPKDDFPFPHIDLLVDSTAGHSMLSFMDGAATTLFHDMMHRDVEVYVDDMIVKSRGKADHLASLEKFFERIQKFRLRLNPKKCTFGVTSRKLLGHMVSERGIEVDPDKIKAILDMLVLRIEKKITGFLGRLQTSVIS